MTVLASPLTWFFEPPFCSHSPSQRHLSGPGVSDVQPWFVFIYLSGGLSCPMKKTFLGLQFTPLPLPSHMCHPWQVVLSRACSVLEENSHCRRALPSWLALPRLCPGAGDRAEGGQGEGLVPGTVWGPTCLPDNRTCGGTWPGCPHLHVGPQVRRFQKRDFLLFLIGSL
uniref:Uncharacterized protein n=1 Tax=Molossus molossus TaxID=27622 RepID=A0A7J8BYG8_MOLMO|nr:hypothetical protein HJG59_010044 [Molossus molossus]